ncbi:hypothetical protein BFW38_14810 [Terasakiispira papahanaumokuakeensis]|uniref:Uncharacterized protein n=1 Tax=Terasakiispira papahanaumokuakeensis TaxID=197479 RepID=A0A1E2VC64_9GAMM|nr:hypothetical protein BFW38_14810 [Terasakiispira papahanaumokuakeensis]
MNDLYNTFPKILIKSVGGSQDISRMDALPTPHHSIHPTALQDVRPSRRSDTVSGSLFNSKCYRSLVSITAYPMKQISDPQSNQHKTSDHQTLQNLVISKRPRVHWIDMDIILPQEPIR